jgi:hypothetical protein
MHDLFEYLRTAGLKHFNILPRLVPLFEPKYLSIQALPKSAKKIARQRLMDELERPEIRGHRNFDIFAGCIGATLDFMDAADTSRELNTFMEFTENSDATFGESWRSAVPEVAAAIDQHIQSRSRARFLTSGARSASHWLHSLRLQRRLRQNAQGPER